MSGLVRQAGYRVLQGQISGFRLGYSMPSGYSTSGWVWKETEICGRGRSGAVRQGGHRILRGQGVTRSQSPTEVTVEVLIGCATAFWLRPLGLGHNGTDRTDAIKMMTGDGLEGSVDS